jgi:hypothetical protein
MPMTQELFEQLIAQVNALDLQRGLPDKRGRFQQLRRSLHPRIQAQSLFNTVSPPKDGYAFHWGGNSELQLNVGLEDGGNLVRVGVAFSIEPMAHNLDLLQVLGPKAGRFNAWVIREPSLLEGLDHCYWQPRNQEPRRQRFPAGPIPEEALQNNRFIFMGTLLAQGEATPVRVLDHLEFWHRLYERVESGALPVEATQTTTMGLLETVHREPNPLLMERRQHRPPEGPILHGDLHRRIEHALYGELRSELDDGTAVRANEFIPGCGTQVDMVAYAEGGPIFFEIKTADTLRACLREALGQILEYAHWAGTERCRRMVVVAQHPMDEKASAYLGLLQDRYQLPLDYRQVQPVEAPVAVI